MPRLKKVILVEDDELDADMTQRALRNIPLANEIIWLETGQELLDYLEKVGWEDIAVVIMDLKMPQVSGIDALRIIKSKDYGYFPVVILTSSRENPDIAVCYELGASAFITKPVAQQEFCEVIKTLGMFWGIFNNLPEPQSSQHFPESN
jgi:two-component system, response regulator